MIFKDIRIIDNFFSPNELGLVLDEAEMSNYVIKGAAYMGYAAEHYCSDEVKNLVLDKISKHLGNVFIHTTSALEGLPPIEFRSATKQDYTRFDNTIHNDGGEPFSDRNLLSICIPLTDTPEGEEMGLKFMYNKILGFYSYAQIHKLDNVPEDSWVEVKRIDYKKNQALLFHPCMFHGPYPNHGYGDNIGNSRLTLHGFLRLGFNDRAHSEDFCFQIKEVKND